MMERKPLTLSPLAQKYPSIFGQERAPITELPPRPAAFRPHGFLLALPTQPVTSWKSFPAVPCVYWIVDSQFYVLYVGDTVNLRLRWKKHRSSKPILEKPDTGCQICWFLAEDSKVRNNLETASIHFFCPPWNRQREYMKELGRQWLAILRQMKPPS